MRIIAGEAGGIPIKVPALVTRPTSDRVREALFSMLGGMMDELRVLDLFSGSGALGIESLSRGAIESVFVEQNAAACGIITSNLEKCRLTGGRVLKGEVFSVLPRLVAAGNKYDVIFADPPYAKQADDENLTEKLLASAELVELLAPEGRVVLESMVTKQASDAMSKWQVLKDRDYGSTRIRILTLPTPTAPAPLSHGQTDPAAVL